MPDVIPELVRAEADGLYRRMNERLDEVLNGLRTDMLGRDQTDDAISWLLTGDFMKKNITEDFARNLLCTALYRLARKEGD